MSNLCAARLVGLLFLLSTSSYLIASNIFSGVINLPDYAEQAYLHKDMLTIAALLEFVNSAAVIGIALVLYPIIRALSERIALTYVSFRIVEAIMLLIGASTLISLTRLSNKLIEATADNAEYFQIMAYMLRVERYVDFQLGMLPLAICGFILCITFYQHKLVPRYLSILGFIGYLLLFVKITADFFAQNIGGQLLYIPGAIFELFLPLWLIFKGFNLPESHVLETK